MPQAQPFIEFVPVGWDELAKRFGFAREYLYGAVITAYRRTGHLLVPRLKAETPVGATSRLRNTTVFQVLGKTEDLRMEIRQSSASPDGFFYGVAVRQGTRPHFPPVSALIPWVVKKLGISEPKQAKRVAYAIAVKISRVGTKPNPYHERVLAASLSEIRGICIEEAVNLAARLEGTKP